MRAADLSSKLGAADGGRIVSSFEVSMPRLIYGTAWKKERTAGLVELALRSGFRGVDTACQPKHYNEAGVGDGLSAALSNGLARSEIYVQTKFTPLSGQDPNDVPYDPRASLSEQVAQSFERSLRNLRTDYLDGLLLHSPYSSDADTLAVWRAMERLYDQGGARQLGVSNFYDVPRLEALYRNARIKPAVIQNRFYAKTQHDKDIRAFGKKNGLVYQSFWTLTANPEVLVAPAMSELATKYDRSPAQLFFRYLTQMDIVCLTGTSSKEHMEQDLSIFEICLSPTECETVGTLLRQS